MEQKRESVFSKAKQETMSAFGTVRFWLFELLLVAFLGVFVALWQPSWAKEGNVMIYYQVLVPVAGAILGLVIVFLILLFLAPYHQRNEARTEIEKITQSMAYSLQVVRVVGNWPKNADGLGVAIHLRNTFGKPLRYQVKTIAAKLDDTVLETPNFSNNGGIIYDETDFILPVLLPKADPSKFHNGIVDFTIDYGRPDDRARRRINASVTINIDSTTTTYYWKRLQEDSVTLEFTDEKPGWQPMFDTGKNQTGASL